MNTLPRMLAAVILCSGCIGPTHPHALPTIMRPITVTSWAPVLERSDCLIFTAADKKVFGLTIDRYGEQPVYYIESAGYSSGNIEKDTPIRLVLIDALQEFVDSRVTPSQLKQLEQKYQTKKENLNHAEECILGATGFLVGLKQIGDAANKILEDTGTSAPDPQD